jgi:hypothetical protein
LLFLCLHKITVLNLKFLISTQMKNNKQRYEAPQAEIIEIEPQGILCTSPVGPTPAGPNGNGIHFGTNNGQW